MGYIKLHYTIKNTKLPLEKIIQEIEYGSTFALYNHKEDIITNELLPLKWVTWVKEGDETILIIEDSFFEIDFFFEKFLSIFVYNLFDFGDIKLNKIDIHKSKLLKYIKPVNSLSKFGKGYFTGSIYKPYYHLPLEERIEQAKLYTDNGLNMLKNDECYFKNKSEIIVEATSLLKVMDSKAYYIPNVTSYLNDYEYINELIALGVEIFMVDFMICGFNQIYRLKQNFPNIKIWGHRIGYAALENNVSMQVISILALISGIDFLHIGTPTSRNVFQQYKLYKELSGLKQGFLPIFTKTTPEILQSILPVFKDNAIYMSCGYFRDNSGIINWDNVRIWSEVFKS